LLCSDGLTNEISDGEILAITRECHHSIQLCAETLVDRAVAAGGRDNVSAIIVRRT
jgi:protein phosphatase